MIAHEYGHHVQTLTGITKQVDDATRENPDQRNALSVRIELQADCLAGVWAHSTFERGLLEQGDLEEGLTAAGSVGDDRIQEQATGRISPETFTHGTAEQRTPLVQDAASTGATPPRATRSPATSESSVKSRGDPRDRR